MPTASKILTLFTRTPLHVGAGASVGAIDQPIIRERHTGLPIIPGSSLKGVLADLWHADTDKTSGKRDLTKDITWLFGSDTDTDASAGALSFGEARLLAFPTRSARGSFAWLTSPTLLARAARDGVAKVQPLPDALIAALKDDQALFITNGPLSLPPTGNPPANKVVLEDYPFSRVAVNNNPALNVVQLNTLLDDTAKALAALLPAEPVLADLPNRLVIVSDGMMSFFAKTSCEIAQHVRINDATGTADDGGLFNQENVPAETLFYAVIHATVGRSSAHRQNQPAAALGALATRLQSVNHTLQIGGDATTGLGYCTATLAQ